MTISAGSARFRTFLHDTGLSTREAAKRIGCNRSFVSHLSTGRSRPSLEVAVTIERLTAQWSQGPIRPDEWVRPAPSIEARSTEAA